MKKKKINWVKSLSVWRKLEFLHRFIKVLNKNLKCVTLSVVFSIHVLTYSNMKIINQWKVDFKIQSKHFWNYCIVYALADIEAHEIKKNIVLLAF